MKKMKIVALGNSITNGVREGVLEEDTFRHLLQEDLSKATGHHIEVINAGISGDITSLAMHRVRKDVLQPEPDYATVMYGVNDAGYYRPVTDSMADTPRVLAADFKANLETIIDIVQKGGVKPVLVTPVPMNSFYTHKDYPAYVENGLNYLVDEYADIVRDLAKRSSIPLIDVHRVFSADSETDNLVPDGIHPNKAGHRLIGDIFIKEFTKIISGKS